MDEIEYRKRYAAQLVLHRYTEVEARESADAAEIDPSDMEPEDEGRRGKDNMSPLKPEIVKKMSQLGYWTLYGKGGVLHIIRRSEFRRGARAMCGATASKRDYHFDKEPCPECMRLCAAEVSAKQSAQQIGDTSCEACGWVASHSPFCRHNPSNKVINR